MPRRYPDAVGVKKPVKSERSHEENQERAYIAASRRSDRSLEARVASARLASEIHKKRTGKGFKITEEIVSKEEMYEEEDDDMPMSIRAHLGHLNTGSAHLNARMDAYVAKHMGMAQMAREHEIGQQFDQHFPGFKSMSARARMMQQQQQQQLLLQQSHQQPHQQQTQAHQVPAQTTTLPPQHSRHLSFTQDDSPARGFSQSPISGHNPSPFQLPVSQSSPMTQTPASPDLTGLRRHTIQTDALVNSPELDTVRLLPFQRHDTNYSVSTPGLSPGSGKDSPQTQVQSPDFGNASPFCSNATTTGFQPMMPAPPLVNTSSVFTSQLPANVEQMLSGPWSNYGDMSFDHNSIDPPQSPPVRQAEEVDIDSFGLWIKSEEDEKPVHGFINATSAEAHGYNSAYVSPMCEMSMFSSNTDRCFNPSLDGLADDVNYNFDMDQYVDFGSFGAQVDQQP